MGRLDLARWPITGLEEACRLFTRLTGASFRDWIRGDRGPLAGEFVLNGRQYLLTFKNDFLHSYSSLYPQEKGKGYGQSMDERILDWGCERDGYLVIVMADRKMYGKRAWDWKSYAVEHGTFRTPEGESRPQYSIPARDLVPLLKVDNLNKS